MPNSNESPTGKGNSDFNETAMQERFRFESRRGGAVFSANASYNPTSLAVETSLRDIFDEFQLMVTGKLKALQYEDE